MKNRYIHQPTIQVGVYVTVMHKGQVFTSQTDAGAVKQVPVPP